MSLSIDLGWAAGHHRSGGQPETRVPSPLAVSSGITPSTRSTTCCTWWNRCAVNCRRWALPVRPKRLKRGPRGLARADSTAPASWAGCLSLPPGGTTIVSPTRRPNSVGGFQNDGRIPGRAIAAFGDWEHGWDGPSHVLPRKPSVCDYAHSGPDLCRNIALSSRDYDGADDILVSGPSQSGPSIQPTEIAKVPPLCL